MSDNKVVNSDQVLVANAADRQDEETIPKCAIRNKKFYVCPADHGWFCDCTGEHDSGLLTDEQLAEFRKPDRRVSALRKRLEKTGYKSIWQTETINHAGDRTVISSWVPKEVPAAETNKGYKFSIYEDVLLLERYEGVDGVYPGEYGGSSTYIHGVEPIVNPGLFRRWQLEQGEDDATEE